MKRKKTKSWQLFWVMVGLPMCWVFLRFSGWQWEEYPVLTACFSGIAIVSAAFLLCWAAEVAQKDVSQALALAFLALIAVLPEYAVDMYFTWIAGKNPQYIPYAMANMTGANRLLIGFGWSLVVILYWLTKKAKEVKMEEGHKVEISFLALATLYSFIIPIKGSLSLIDAVILLSLFVFYIISAAKAHVTEPDLIGPAMEIGKFPDVPRRLIITSLFLYSAFVILISAEPFAESLLTTGRIFKIDKFILVQWLAPLASESPEIIAATLFVLKAKPTMGLGTLVSSKVNQWTLLVGMIPIVFCISAGKVAPMPIDARQMEEIFLTAAQSAFGVSILISLSISVGEALILFILFVTQLMMPSKEIRLIYGFVYLTLAFFIFYKDKARLKRLFKK
ncbi:MAG: sodium:calcium antiporter [bacterium]|nr:sodium:calcium antiporter [bacterium]